ncbi:MAG: serine/threonine-protein kinase [Myxococcota bacterium]
MNSFACSPNARAFSDVGASKDDGALDTLLRSLAHAPSLVPRDRDPRIGSKLGPYRIVERIAEGGMGLVYRAFDERLEREVAIKTLDENAMTDAAPLLEEARRAAALNHPGIATVFDVGSADDPYIVMELVKGDTLASRLSMAPPSWSEAFRFARAIAESLAALHGAGFVHRDLSPNNVVLDGASIKLIDFGLAVHRRERVRSDLLYAGTLRYAAPEQLEAGGVDAHADVYAFGMLLQAMLEGARGTSKEMRAAKALIDECTLRDPKRRPADGRALVRRLAAMHRRSFPVAAAAAGIAAVLLAIGFAVLRADGATVAPASEEAARVADPAATAEPAATVDPAATADAVRVPPHPLGRRSLARVDSLAASPSGERYAWAKHGRVYLSGRSLERPESVAGTLYAGAVAFVGEDRLLALGTPKAGGDSVGVPHLQLLTSSGPGAILRAERVRGIAASPDGRALALAFPDELCLVPAANLADAMNRRRCLPMRNGELTYDAPAWSPDGRHVAVVRCDVAARHHECALELIDVDAQTTRRLISEPRLLSELGTSAVAFDGDGALYAVVAPSASAAHCELVRIGYEEREPDVSTAARLPFSAVEDLVVEGSTIRYIGYERERTVELATLTNRDGVFQPSRAPVPEGAWLSDFDRNELLLTVEDTGEWRSLRWDRRAAVAAALSDAALTWPRRHGGRVLAWRMEESRGPSLVSLDDETRLSTVGHRAAPESRFLGKPPPHRTQLVCSRSTCFIAETNVGGLEIRATTGSHRFRLEVRPEGPQSIAVSSDGETYVTGHRTRVVWRDADGRPSGPRVDAPEGCTIQKLALHPDGRTLYFTRVCGIGSAHSLHAVTPPAAPQTLAEFSYRWPAGLLISRDGDELGLNLISMDNRVYEQAL